MKNNRPSLPLAFASYAIGAAAGMFLILVAAWADMESSTYGFARLADAGLRGLSCPVLMTRNETRLISLNVSNRTDGRISPSIKAQISTALLPEEFLENIELAPGSSKRLEWAVGPENIDLGNFIFAKVLLYSAYPRPAQEATCGIFVISLPGTGRMIASILVALSLIGMGWGVYQMNRSPATAEWRRKHMGLVTFLALMIILGLVLSFLGGWIFSLIVLVIGLLTIIILLSSILAGKSRYKV